MNLKDRVIVHKQGRSFDKASASIGTIVDETKTAWRVEYGEGLGTVRRLFRKTDLYLRTEDEFNNTHIMPYTQEKWQEYSRALLRRTVINTLSRFDWSKVDTETLIKIHKEACESKRKQETT